MFENFRDKIALSGVTILVLGIALLIFTFVSAYGFLTQSLSIIASADLTRTFGEALAPLIATSIRIMYLGIMGWIGSLVTIRGITIIAHLPELPKATSQKATSDEQMQPVHEEKTEELQPVQEEKTEELQKEQQKEKTEEMQKEQKKEEPETSEPQFAVIPPQEIPQAVSPQGTPEKSDSQSTS
jgi:hypothetical protein